MFRAALICSIINSLFTIACGVTILYFVSKRKLERHLFYYGWSVGFILYGVQILLRALSLEIHLASLFMVIAFILFPLSTWILNPRKDVTLLLFVLFLFFYIFIAGLFFTGILQYNELIWTIGSTFFFLPLTFLLIIHRKMFGNCADKLIIGWSSLYLINILIPMGDWITDILAIFCKAIILAGILSYDFAIVTQKIRSGLSQRILSSTTGYGKEGGINLLLSLPSKNNLPTSVILEWIEMKVKENIKRNIATSIIVLQNVIPYTVLRSLAWIKPSLVHIFIFSQSPMIEEEFTTIKYGITELGATISEIATKHFKEKSEGEIILADLSVLIHTFGVKKAYTLLLNKLGTLRVSGTKLTAIMHPETHDEQTLSLFKSIADNVIQIS